MRMRIFARRSLISMFVLTVLFALLGTPALAAQITTANDEIPVAGTVTGSYLDTHDDDGVYEAILERESGGKPSNRHSFLVHKWTFDVPAGSYVTFFVQAFHTANSEGDDFDFAWSTDDSNYIDILRVTKTSDDDTFQSASLPANLSGTIYIRGRDADSTQGNRALDTLYVDSMYIESGGSEVPPAAPSDLEARTFSDTAIDLSWADNAGNEDGFRIERSLDGVIWDPPVTVGANVTAFQDTNLLPDTTYYYHVHAFNAYGDSDWSNVASNTTWPAFTFITEIVDPDQAGYYQSLAYDLNGRPGIAYSKEDGFVHFAQWNGAAWEFEIVGEGSLGISFAYSPNGRASVSYEKTGGKHKLMFAEKIGSTWSIEVVDIKTFNDHTSLAFDHEGNPSIAYNRWAHGFWFARRINGIWGTELIDPIKPRYKSVAYDPQGNPSIAYPSVVDNLYCVKFAHWNGVSWDIEVVETAEESGEYVGIGTHLAYDPTTDWPAIVHSRDSSWYDKLRIVRWNGTTWEGETIVDNAVGWVSGLAFTSQGTPYIGYLCFGQPPGGGHWVTHWDGVSWVREIVAGWDWGRGRLALDANEEPSFAWARDGELRFLHK